ncbi:PDZ domain-containing protein [Nonomuraea phyllanthi]|uniref:S1C family serine protease n=1 Tax=Nonomuraea phyllanthi TaxID=2219224 RepID=UPI0012931F40|nr:trypsin-like peptidase domain-containing protein [Nonomuraea phyllanthi]QFY13537.1 PDZ domain-containing protein [Nonomuraea phyllanthi]
MDANSPREDNAGGWSQFGNTPPTAGGFTRPGPVLPPPPPPRRQGFMLSRKAIAGLAVAAMAALTVAALGGGAVGAYVASGSQPVPTVTATVASPVFRTASGQLTVAEVAEKVQPSVVMIQGQTAEGSGVVLSDDGQILTNNHVVAGQTGALTVKFSDGKTAKASVVGTDPATDLAVIKADGVSGLAKATLGDSDQLKVGDDVLAIGSPLGLDGTVTAGIVSALDRTVTSGDSGGQDQQLPPGWGGQRQPSETTTLGGMIQTDAAINFGNSGGALVNAAGELVGINSAIAADGVNLGFAIPVNTAKQVSDQLISKGKVSHVFLGVSVTDATGDVPGALIRQVVAGSPAEKAGLKQGDLITKIGDTPVQGGDTVVGQVRGFKVGQQVQVTYQRNGKSSTVTVTMEEKK